ncbi:MAG TPA: HAMP domain-containing sensor histidine kinase [Capillimicrobium sp.]|nr:HAMP domain-containing sensor histidine kinase [Capillimicrobium sp.]
MSIRRRLVLLAAGAVAVAVAGAAVTTYVLARAQLRGQVDDSLRRMAPAIRTDGLALPALGAGAVLRARLELPEGPLGKVPGAAQLFSADGEVISSTPGAAPLPETDAIREVVEGGRQEALADATVDGVHVRVLAMRGPSGDVLQVVRPLAEVDAALRRLAVVLALVALAGVAVAAGLGLLVARAALGPLARLTGAAEELARTGDLSHRLPDAGRDEVHRLGAAFNRVLAALRLSRDAQRQLVADASHELRTPLTSVRANVELLGRAPDLPEAERERVVAATSRQLEELTVLVGDLVDLARGAGPVEDVEEVRLDTLVAEAVERARAHAPATPFALDARPVVVEGSPARLHRAVGNLLDNAVKHGGGPAQVDVSVVGDGRHAVVSVRDRGPGIAERDLPLVFDRFYRAPAARGLPGSGLGLAIVRQVAEAHGGSVRAEPAAGGGTRVSLRVPAAS